MTTLRRSLLALLMAGALGCGFCLTAAPVQAGYGNHAERATENIQTRVGLAKLSLLSQVSQFKVVESRGGLPQP